MRKKGKKRERKREKKGETFGRVDIPSVFLLKLLLRVSFEEFEILLEEEQSKESIHLGEFHV